MKVYLLFFRIPVMIKDIWIYGHVTKTAANFPIFLSSGLRKQAQLLYINSYSCIRLLKATSIVTKLLKSYNSLGSLDTSYPFSIHSKCNIYTVDPLIVRFLNRTKLSKFIYIVRFFEGKYFLFLVNLTKFGKVPLVPK